MASLNRARLRFVTIGALASTALPIVREALCADPVALNLATLVEQVHENESRYRNLETIVRKTKTLATPGNPKGWAITETRETVHTIVQGDLIYCHADKTDFASSGESTTRERVSAYDGEKTRSVEYDNSANIHLGRYESTDVCPPHCWAMIPQRVNFPLSTLLGGTDSFLKDPRVRRQSFFEFNRVEITLAGEEVVDGLRCLKVVCRHWSGTDPKGKASTLAMWLAAERNYLCVRSEGLLDFGGQERRFRETRVDGLREAAPGLWLPSRIFAQQFDIESLRGGREIPEWEETLVLHKTVLNPARPAGFFREIRIPDDVPVFGLENGRLAGKAFRDVPPAADSAKRLKEIIKQVQANEGLYASMAAVMQKEHRHSEQVALMSTLAVAAERAPSLSGSGYQRDLRVSVANGPKTWFSQIHDDLAADGTVVRRTEELEVGDGQWLRKRWTHSGEWPGGRPLPAGASVKLRGPELAGIHRPHAVFERDYKSPRPLSALLASKWEDEVNGYAMEVGYLGEDIRDGHSCEVVKLSTIIPPEHGPYYIRLVWFAKDRNYIPIRMEGHEPRWSPSLPTCLYTADDFREIAPGVWMPHQHRMLAFKKTDVTAGKLTAFHRTDYQIESVKLDPDAAPDELSEFIVPAGIEVMVESPEGRFVGKFTQETTGPLTIASEYYKQLQEVANQRKKK
ncbi:MAG: hypothetical protein ACT4QC_09460 [Planctomycetaceae bacterium]